MITATNATKRFEDITAVDHICAEVQNGSVHVPAHAGRHFAAG